MFQCNYFLITLFVHNIIYFHTVILYQVFLSNTNNLQYLNSNNLGRVFANGPGDLGLIPGCVIPKTLKMVLDTSLVNT